jgi:hypothetical protein
VFDAGMEMAVRCTFFALFLSVASVVSVVVAASLFSLNENLNILARVVNAVSDVMLVPRDNDRLWYLRITAVGMAIGVLCLELLGCSRPGHLVLVGTDHAPATVG